MAPSDYVLEDGSQLLYFIDDTHAVHLFPDTKESRELYASNVAPNGYFFLVDKAASSVAGYQVIMRASKL